MRTVRRPRRAIALLAGVVAAASAIVASPPPVAASWTDRAYLRASATGGEDYQVSTIAGNGLRGYVDGAALSAEFYNDVRLTIDAAGNLYAIDVGNAAIRKITPGGIVSTLAGNGTTGYADGVGTAARFYNPTGIAIDAAGDLYVSEGRDANRIRKITPTGVVSTVAGSTVLGITIGADDSNQGFVNGVGTAARFAQPAGLAFDAAGNLYVADVGNQVIRMIAPDGTVSTYAGSGTQGFADGSAGAARFNLPVDVAVDPAGDVFVADSGNYRVRRIAPDRTVSNYAGSGRFGYLDGAPGVAQFARPSGVAIAPDGTVYVTDGGLRVISPDRQVSTLWHSAPAARVDGSVRVATYVSLGDVLLAGDSWIVADNGEHMIRRIVRAW